MKVCPVCLTGTKDMAFGCGHMVSSFCFYLPSIYHMFTQLIVVISESHIKATFWDNNYKLSDHSGINSGFNEFDDQLNADLQRMWSKIISLSHLSSTNN